ncbi:MAG: tetratricopeptide repeat protein [Candidatus Omnitrophica bacterium]|nr:tetratricopeptide repeat protein [Candidatus Omnitrophota bacterium]
MIDKYKKIGIFVKDCKNKQSKTIRRCPQLIVLIVCYFIFLLLAGVGPVINVYGEKQSKMAENKLVDYCCDEGIMLYGTGDYKEAAKLFNRALMLDSEHELAKEYLRRIKSMFKDSGLKIDKSKDKSKGKSKGKIRKDSLKKTENKLVDYCCDEGKKLYEAGNYKEAVKLFNRALIIDSEHKLAKEYLRKIKSFFKDSGLKTKKSEGKIREEILKQEIKRLEQGIGEFEIKGLEEEWKMEEEWELEEEWGKHKWQINKKKGRNFELEHVPKGQKETAKVLNEHIEPVMISGEYRLGMGVYSNEEVEWKKADADLQENGWRYLYGDKRFNTFDPAIYSRLRLNIKASVPENWNLGVKLVVDPWSFRGKTQRFRIYNSAKSDYADIQLKYWSNLDTTISQTIRTHKGNVLDISEIRIKDGKIVPTAVSAAWSDELQQGWTDSFGTIPDYKISQEFKPIRNLWAEYKSDEWRIRVFPLGGQEEALTSDDPLGLSNHHIYWEPSPWLDYWQAGVHYTASAVGWEDGEWKKDWYTEDSGHQWLRRLRGISFSNSGHSNLYLQATAAAPLDVWDNYSELNALPMAIRLKYKLSEKWQLGTTQTGRIGYSDKNKDATVWAGGVDLQCELSKNIALRSEIAHSRKKENLLTSARKEEKDDEAYKTEFAVKIPTLFPNYYQDIPLDVDLSYTQIGENFYAPLASYAYTRDDRAWGRYLSFFPRSFEDEAVRLGDSADVNRKVYNFTLKSKLFNSRLRPLFNYRNAHRVSSSKFVEGIYRGELEYDILSNFKSKLMYVYSDKPEDNQQRKISTERIAGGLRYKFTGWLAAETICTHTNEYPEFPDNIYTWLGKSPYNVNPDPPYPYYNIYKGRIIYQMFPELSFTFDHTTNEFDFANRIADDYYYDELSYDGVEIKYEPIPKLIATLIYRYSQLANLNQYVDSKGKIKDIEEHHNFYGELNYKLDPDSCLTLQYGDLGIYANANYIPFTHAVLDTQHLVRAFWTQKF